MQALENLLKTRYERANLDMNKCYDKIQRVGGTETITYVGQFVTSYRMGSGDGMSIHWEFNNNGKVVRVDDDMWGSIGGEELAGFRVALSATAQPATALSATAQPAPTSIKYERISCINGFD